MFQKMGSLLKFVMFTGVLLGLFKLGLWQIDRLHWKMDLIKKVQLSTGFEELDLELRPVTYTKVTFSGDPIPEKMVFIGPRHYKGDIGFHVYLPIKVESKVVFVNLGWAHHKEHFKIEDQKIHVEGLIAYPVLPAWYMPQNKIMDDEWLSFQLLDAGNRMDNHQPITPYYIMARKLEPRLSNIKTIDPILRLRNNHLGYAVTWFSLALTFLVMCGFVVMKRLRDQISE